MSFRGVGLSQTFFPQLLSNCYVIANVAGSATAALSVTDLLDAQG
jgi:hypothetical protein